MFEHFPLSNRQFPFFFGRFFMRIYRGYSFQNIHFLMILTKRIMYTLFKILLNKNPRILMLMIGRKKSQNCQKRNVWYCFIVLQGKKQKKKMRKILSIHKFMMWMIEKFGISVSISLYEPSDITFRCFLNCLKGGRGNVQNNRKKIFCKGYSFYFFVKNIENSRFCIGITLYKMFNFR